MRQTSGFKVTDIGDRLVDLAGLDASGSVRSFAQPEQALTVEALADRCGLGEMLIPKRWRRKATSTFAVCESTSIL